VVHFLTFQMMKLLGTMPITQHTSKYLPAKSETGWNWFVQLISEPVNSGFFTYSPQRAFAFSVRKAAVQLCLRFALVYLFLESWIWLDELAVNPSRPVRPVFNAIFGGLARWLGHHVFHLGGPIEPSSLRDSVYMYLLLLSIGVISAIAAIIWLAADFDGRTVSRAYELLRIWIRYTLAYMVLIYAWDKVFRIQFTAPDPMRLTESYGESSPMALMWTFVGYSGFYTVFSGLAELAGALLLLFRRTVLLGALILTAVMANVALMDFCYDVSVKMLAIHFLFMSIFLLTHDAARLLNVLVLNRSAKAPEDEALMPPRSKPRMRYVLLALKVVVVLYIVVPGVVRTYHAFRIMGPYAARPPLYGLYEVGSFKENGVERPLLVNDNQMWRYVAIENPGEVLVKTMDDTVLTYQASYDPITHRIHMRRSDAGSPSADLQLSALGSGTLSVNGESGKDQIAVLLHAVNVSRFPLVNRGFHWVNGTSYWR
jgi:hypothetical protein